MDAKKLFELMITCDNAQKAQFKLMEKITKARNRWHLFSNYSEYYGDLTPEAKALRTPETLSALREQMADLQTQVDARDHDVLQARDALKKAQKEFWGPLWSFVEPNKQ